MKKSLILLYLLACNYCYCSNNRSKKKKIVSVKKSVSNVPVINDSEIKKNNDLNVKNDISHNDINNPINQSLIVDNLLKDDSIIPSDSETKKNDDGEKPVEKKDAVNKGDDNSDKRKPLSPEEQIKEDKRIAAMVDEYIKQNPPSKGISTQDILKGVGLLLTAVFGTIAAYGIGKLLKSVSSKEVDKAFKEIGKTANQFGDFLSGKKGELKLSDGRVIKGQELMERLDEFNGLMKKLGSPQGLIKRSMDLFENFVASPKSTVRDFLTRTKELKDVDYSKLLKDLLGLKEHGESVNNVNEQSHQVEENK